MRKVNDYRPTMEEQEARAAELMGWGAARASESFLDGYRYAALPDDRRPSYLAVSRTLSDRLLTAFVRGWAAGVVAFGAGVDLSGGAA